MSTPIEKNDIVSLLETIKEPQVPNGTIGQIQQVIDSTKVEVIITTYRYEQFSVVVPTNQLYVFKHHTTLTYDDFWTMIEDSQEQAKGDEEAFITNSYRQAFARINSQHLQIR